MTPPDNRYVNRLMARSERLGGRGRTMSGFWMHRIKQSGADPKADPAV
jgi:hypothetical protein